MRLGKLLSVGEAADDQNVTPAQAEPQPTAEKSSTEIPEPAVAVRVRLTNPRLWMPAFSVKVFTATEKK